MRRPSPGSGAWRPARMNDKYVMMIIIRADDNIVVKIHRSYLIDIYIYIYIYILFVDSIFHASAIALKQGAWQRIAAVEVRLEATESRLLLVVVVVLLLLLLLLL